MVFGTFDGLHEGHKNFFKQARKYGDYLLVVVGRDENVEKMKGHLPQRNENERMDELKKCDLINEVRLGHESDPFALIEEIKPDVICLGYDQQGYANNLDQNLKQRGLNIKIFRMRSFKPDVFHSSILNKK